jgi:hypothetical protein
VNGHVQGVFAGLLQIETDPSACLIKVEAFCEPLVRRKLFRLRDGLRCGQAARKLLRQIASVLA